MDLDTLANPIGEVFFPPSVKLEQWGKLKLKNGHVLCNTFIELPEMEGSIKRYYHWFKVGFKVIYSP